MSIIRVAGSPSKLQASKVDEATVMSIAPYVVSFFLWHQPCILLELISPWPPGCRRCSIQLGDSVSSVCPLRSCGASSTHAVWALKRKRQWTRHYPMQCASLASSYSVAPFTVQYATVPTGTESSFHIKTTSKASKPRSHMPALTRPSISLLFGHNTPLFFTLFGFGSGVYFILGLSDESTVHFQPLRAF